MVSKNNSFLNQEDAGFSLYEAINEGNKEAVSELLLSVDTRPDLSMIKPRFEKEEDDEESIHPLVLAVCYPEIFENFLDAYNENINLFDKENALKESAILGLWDPIETLLTTNPQIDNDCKGVALRLAVENAHSNIVNKLLTLFSNRIDNVYKLTSLRCALRNQNAAVLNALLADESVIEASIHSIKSIFQQVGVSFPNLELVKPGYEYIINKITSIPGVDLIRKIYLECSKKYSKNNDVENKIIKDFLEKNSSKIKKEYKKAALELAVEEGRVDILNALLSDTSILEIATWKSNVTLREAKRNAENNFSKNKEEIIHALMKIPAVSLLEKAGDTHDESLLDQYIKPSDKGRALVIAAENNNVKFTRSILNVWGNMISEKYKIQAIINTIEENNIDAFSVFLDDALSFSKKIKPRDLGQIFIVASNTDEKFFELVLQKWGALIPDAYKKKATIDAVKQCNLEIFTRLLDDESIYKTILDDDIFEIFLREKIKIQMDVSEDSDYQAMIDRLDIIHEIGKNDCAGDRAHKKN